MTNRPTSGHSAARRRFGKRALATAALALMPGAFAPAFAQDLKGEITLMAYSGIFQDQYLKTVVEPFEKAHPGVKVNYFTAGNSAQMLGTVRAQKDDPQVDVVIFDVSTSLIGDKEGVLSKLSTEEVPNLADLAPQAIVKEGYGPAVTFDNLVLLYNTEAVKTAPTSINALWEPEHAHKISVSAMPDIRGACLTAIVAHSIGEDYTKGIDKTVEKLASLAPSVQTFDAKPDDYTLIMNGEVNLAVGWNARAQYYNKQSNGKLASVLPSEGSVLQINTINLVEKAPNPDLAKAFINYALSPEAQAAFTNAMFYAPVNTKAEISEEAKQKTAATMLDKMLPFDWEWEATVADKWNQAWKRRIIASQ